MDLMTTLEADVERALRVPGQGRSRA
jgi:hypothetical protein